MNIICHTTSLVSTQLLKMVVMKPTTMVDYNQILIVNIINPMLQALQPWSNCESFSSDAPAFNANANGSHSRQSSMGAYAALAQLEAQSANAQR